MKAATTTEKRAKAYAEWLANCVNNGNTVTFSIEWGKSRMWGHNPQVYDRDGARCLNVSGCGYDKTSVALAHILRFLPDLTEEQAAEVDGTAGAGECETARVLCRFGWRISVNSAPRTCDVVTLRKATPEEVAKAVEDYEYDRNRRPA